MHKILLEKPRFDQIFFVSLEIFKKNWKKIFKMYVIFLIAISLLGILNYLFGDYMYTFQESNSAILVLNIFEAIVSIYISIIPFIGLLYFVKDKLYESDEKSIREYIKIGKSKAMTYMETIFIFVISLIGIGIGLTLIFNALFLPLISLFSSEIAIFFLDIFLIIFLLIFIFLIIKYSTYWSFWGATLIYQGMTGFDTLKKSRQIVSGNFGQIFSYNAIILLISLILKSTSIGLLILTGNLIPFYIIIFALTFINLFFIVFYSVYFLSFEIWHAQRTMMHDLKLTADGEHKG